MNDLVKRARDHAATLPKTTLYVGPNPSCTDPECLFHNKEQYDPDPTRALAQRRWMMGLNSTVVILNDYLHEIENDPEFGKKLSRAIQNPSDDGRHYGFHVVTCHHNSATSVIAVNGNRGRVIGWAFDRAADDDLIKELERLRKQRARTKRLATPSPSNRSATDGSD